MPPEGLRRITPVSPDKALQAEHDKLLRAYDRAWHLKRATGWRDTGEVAVTFEHRRNAYLDFVEAHPEFA